MLLPRILILLSIASGIIAATEPESSQLIVSVAELPTMFPVLSKTTGETIIPGIEIYSDGTTIIKRRDGHDLAKHIDGKQLHELITFIDNQHIFDLTTERIAQDIEKARPFPPPTDQVKTILFVTSGERKVTISQYAFPFFAEKLPQVESLQIMNHCIGKIYEAAGETR